MFYPTYTRNIEDKIFQDIPRRMAKIREKWPRDVEKSVVGKKKTKLKMWADMPNVMAALPNVDGALCSTPQSLANAHYYSAVQKRYQLAGVPQTN